MKNLLAGREDFPTDIRGIAKAFASENVEAQSFSVLIMDLPLHRNSVAGMSGKVVGLMDTMRGVAEFIDDAPLGRQHALVTLIIYALELVEKTLAIGGVFYFKVVEPWSADVFEYLYALLVRFEKLEVYRNPYSKDTSKELYFVFKNKIQSALPVNREHKAAFYKFMLSLVSTSISLLSVNLVRLARRYGGEVNINRSIVCRKKLYNLTTDLLHPLGTYKVPSVNRAWGLPMKSPVISLKTRGDFTNVIGQHGFSEKYDITEAGVLEIRRLHLKYRSLDGPFTYKDLWVAYMAYGKNAEIMLDSYLLERVRPEVVQELVEDGFDKYEALEAAKRYGDFYGARNYLERNRKSVKSFFIGAGKVVLGCEVGKKMTELSISK